MPAGPGAAPAAAYNSPMRARLLLLTTLLSATAVLAQPPAERDRTDMEARKNQKIERLHHEDAGNTIDELRVGGQTQNITVQPKAAVPAYEIEPDDMARSRPSDNRDGFAERKQRVWNLFHF